MGLMEVLLCLLWITCCDPPLLPLWPDIRGTGQAQVDVEIGERGNGNGNVVVDVRIMDGVQVGITVGVGAKFQDVVEVEITVKFWNMFINQWPWF